VCGNLEAAEAREWLVTNGIGGFASGTIAGCMTRRYHGLLIAALQPPVGRTYLVAGVDETVRYGGAEYRLGTYQWGGGVVDPKGFLNIQSFRLEGMTPVWTFALADALLEKRVWMHHGENTTYVKYTLSRSTGPVEMDMNLAVRSNVRIYAARGEGGMNSGRSLALMSAPKKAVFTKHDKAFYADPNVVAFVRPGLNIAITSAKIANDGTISVGYKLTDPKGLPLDLTGVQTPGAVSVSFVMASLTARLTMCSMRSTKSNAARGFVQYRSRKANASGMIQPADRPHARRAATSVGNDPASPHISTSTVDIAAAAVTQAYLPKRSPTGPMMSCTEPCASA